MTTPDAVLASLGLPPSSDSTPMTGYDATVWRVEVDGRPLALRLLRPGHNAVAELEALVQAAERGVPVPKLVVAGRHDGRDAYASTWCAGRTIGDRQLAGADPWELGTLFGRTHADLHRPAADGTVLCHLDFQPFNVLTEHAKVTGIVDWANARLGDPRADLAKTRVVLALAPALVSGSAQPLATFENAWRHGYAQVRPMPGDAELAPWLRAAAERELESWEPRVAAGEVGPEVVAAARRITETSW